MLYYNESICVAPHKIKPDRRMTKKTQTLDLTITRGVSIRFSEAFGLLVDDIKLDAETNILRNMIDRKNVYIKKYK